jgi:hypothetical protein
MGSRFLLIAVIGVLLAFLAHAYWQAVTLQKALETQKKCSMSDEAARHLAVKYRDDWIRSNQSDDTPFWSRSTIQAFERQTNGFHCSFTTRVSAGGASFTMYMLDVYFRLSGELERVNHLIGHHD